MNEMQKLRCGASVGQCVVEGQGLKKGFLNLYADLLGEGFKDILKTSGDSIDLTFLKTQVKQLFQRLDFCLEDGAVGQFLEQFLTERVEPQILSEWHEDPTSKDLLDSLKSHFVLSALRDDFIEDSKNQHVTKSIYQKNISDKNEIHDPRDVLKSSDLHPVLRDKIKLLLQEAKKQGLNVIPFEGYRSMAKQKRLYESGRGVTRAPAGYSYHNYGLAVDLVFVNEAGKPSWDNQHDWQKLGQIGKKLGLQWGGDFKNLKDMTHFEYHPGLKLNDVRQAYKTGGQKEVWQMVQ